MKTAASTVAELAAEKLGVPPGTDLSPITEPLMNLARLIAESEKTVDRVLSLLYAGRVDDAISKLKDHSGNTKS